MDNKSPHWYTGDIYSKLIIVVAAILALVLREWAMAAFLTVALVLSFLFSELSYRRGVRQVQAYLENAASRLGASESMEGFPFPAASVTSKGKITWYNSAMDKLYAGELLFQKDITSIVGDFDVGAADESGKFPTYKAKVKNRAYEVYAHRVAPQDGASELIMLYFLDISEYVALRKKSADERPALMSVAFDNFEEVMQGLSDENRTIVHGAVERALAAMAAEVGGVIKKIERDRYYIIANVAALTALSNKKFAILELVRSIQTGNAMSPTLSIGIGIEGETLHECDMFARAALDMALGRGGDQVVVKDKTKFRYFGGKTREVEKRTKVKARVVAYALKELITQSDSVVIVGHKNADIDCIGAAMGLVSAVRAMGKKVHIMLHEHDDTVEEIVKNAAATPQYKGVFVHRTMLDEAVTSKTLLIVVDTNTPQYMEHAEMLTAFEQVVVIDHHRRNADFIKNPVLMYHEPYASSTCEMVTEMLQYLSDRNILLPIEAEALYAGIYLDTKYFTFKTGVRTLEAAAFLRRAGVDPVAVKQLFKSDIKTYTMRADLVRSAKIYKKHIAIAVSDEERSPSLIAQAADELLNIAGIDTSFVLARNEGNCIISGRSTDKINVQVILERFGGGGHFSVAGAQLKGETPSAVAERLAEEVEKYLAGN